MKKLISIFTFLFCISAFAQQNISPQNLFVMTAAEQALFAPSSIYLPIQNNWTGYEGPSLEGFWNAFDSGTSPVALSPNTNPGGWFILNGSGSQNHAMLWMSESALGFALAGDAVNYEIAAAHCICLLDSLDFVQGHQRHEAIGLYTGFWEGGAAAMALAGFYAPAGSTSGPHLLASARRWWTGHVALLRRLRMPDGQIARLGARMNHGGPEDDDDENLSAAVNLQLIDPQNYSTLHPKIAARISANGLPQNISVGYNPVTWNEPRAVAERWIVLRAFQSGAILRAPANQSTPFVIEDIYKWNVGNKTYVATPSVTGYHHCRWEVSWQSGQYVHIEVSDSLSVPHGGGPGPWTPAAPQSVSIPSTAKHILGPVFTTLNPTYAQNNSCGNDAAVISIVKPYRRGCLTNINPQVVVKNNGTTPITNLSLYYRIDNFSLYSDRGKGATKCKQYIVSSGSGLLPDSLATLTLDMSTVTPGQHQLKVWVMDVNKMTDVNASNDLDSLTFTVVNQGYPLAYSQDFENVNPGEIPADWSLYDGDSYQNWFVFASNGNHAAALSNFTYTGATNNRDELVMPPLNFTCHSQAWLSFDYSHASQPGSVKFDSLEVLISTDSGLTFANVWGKGGNTLNTVANQSAIFIPAGPQDYMNAQVNLSAYLFSNEAILKFINWSNNGNSTLIDNINVTSTQSTGIAQSNSYATINLFPNPANESLYIEGNLQKAGAIKIKITNLLGEVLNENDFGTKPAGAYKVKLDIGVYAPGAYSIEILSGENKTVCKKLVIAR